VINIGKASWIQYKLTMKMFYILLLVGLVGYIAYPFLPPKLLGISKREVDDSLEPVRETEVKLVESVVIPDKLLIEVESKLEPEVEKIASHKMAKKDELPEIKKEPEEQAEEEVIVKARKLDETDFKIIITNGVEAGGCIDFRKDNIISWTLKEQAISLQGSQYEGEISIEVGSLFGPQLRRAKVVIKDEVITSWEWLVVDPIE
jgi:hypothetical protein|tara:strand:+ start:8127 stop:8738 length:612 start_codon:yes stop_codon:yes gene_type:complete